MKYKNCTQCPSHQIQNDPDPNDWFCDDDVKVYCRIAEQYITRACRPYDIKKECEIPLFCQLKKEN